MTPKGYTAGTHRLVDPAVTLERIRPQLRAHGITRCADVTGLDTIGIPVYCAIRPAARTVQVANGKGIRHVDAEVSALMEAIELYRAEQPPPEALRRASMRELDREQRAVLDPRVLPGFRHTGFFSPDYQIDWVGGYDLLTQERVWVPASRVYLCWPALYEFSSSGLASGNILTEATLHALYELLEHDAIARLSQYGRYTIQESCGVLDLTSIDHPVLTPLIGSIERAGLGLVLFTVPSQGGVTTMWASVWDPHPFANSTIVNFGFGAHLSPAVAASRALTEAAQARLTFIHGSREDFTDEVYACGETQNRLRDYFAHLRPSRRWHELIEPATPSLDDDLELLRKGLGQGGHRRLIRVDLTRSPGDIPVVKLIAPELKPTAF